MFKPALELNCLEEMSFISCAPYDWKDGQAAGFLILHSKSEGQDPYHRYFSYPTDTCRLKSFDASGRLLWSREMGKGVTPGVWFTSLMLFDLNGDGKDEAFLSVNNTSHPLDYETDELLVFDPATGDEIKRMPWPFPITRSDDLSHLHRHMMSCAIDRQGRRRVVLARGTYTPQRLQCFDANWSLCWEKVVQDDSQGSHTFLSADVNDDGAEEILWGVKCLDPETGEDLWKIMEPNLLRHCDTVLPGRYVPGQKGMQTYICREANVLGKGGVFLVDAKGAILWEDRDHVHAHVNWAARLGPAGEFRFYSRDEKEEKPGEKVERFYDLQGRVLPLPMPLAGGRPADVDGDGLHEFCFRGKDQPVEVRKIDGSVLGKLQGLPLWAAKVLGMPGEQIAAWDPKGILRFFAFERAKDSELAQNRYRDNRYKRFLGLFNSGYSTGSLTAI